MSYYAKYIKYKNKYLSFTPLNIQKGGFTCKHENGYKNILGTCWMIAIQMIFSFGGVSGRLLEKNIKKMSIEDMINMAKLVPDIENILPGVIYPSKSVYLEEILNTFIRRYKSKFKLFDMNKTFKPLDLPDDENKERCELVILTNFKKMFKDFIYFNNGYIVEQYLFSNLLSIFLLGRKTSFINYYSSHLDPNKKFSNINYINYENYGILINLKYHTCCFFICGGKEKYYNDNDEKIYPCSWKKLLSETTDTRCLYVQEKGCILLLNNEEYINNENKSKLQKIVSLVVLSTNKDTNSFDNDIHNYMNKSYHLLTPKTDCQILYLTGIYFKYSDDHKNAVKYYKMAANNGHADSQSALGYIYSTNEHLKNLDEAIKYYKMAANNGHVNSQSSLGYIYSTNEHLKNLDEAIKYYKMAANNGDVDSQSALGYIYDNDEQLKNSDEAIKYYKMAANNGDVYSQSALGYIYDNDEQLKNLDEAIKYYKMGANNGDAYSQSALDKIYENNK